MSTCTTFPSLAYHYTVSDIILLNLFHAILDYLVKVSQFNKGEKSFDPQTVKKAALAVFNVRRTSERLTIYNTLEAARSRPFVPP